MRNRAVRAFSLTELLVVIAIVALLVGIVFAVGSQVLAGSKTDATERTLDVLQGMLTEIMADEGRLPPSYVPRPDDPEEIWLVADAQGSIAPSIGLFLLQAERSPGARELIASIPSKLVQTGQYDPGTGSSLSVTIVNDAWGNPIRYVHPAFDGQYDDWESVYVTDGLTIQEHLGLRSSQVVANAANPLRREASQGDADGGLCPSGRPYFYSAGPDGDPSTTDDNVYTDRPGTQDEVQT